MKHIYQVPGTFRAPTGAAPLKHGTFTSANTWWSGTFRAPTGAAPLKQSFLHYNHLGKVTFRAPTGAAPLKHWRSKQMLQQQFPFRAPTGAAPLKPPAGQKGLMW